MSMLSFCTKQDKSFPFSSMSSIMLWTWCIWIRACLFEWLLPSTWSRYLLKAEAKCWWVFLFLSPDKLNSCHLGLSSTGSPSLSDFAYSGSTWLSSESDSSSWWKELAESSDPSLLTDSLATLIRLLTLQAKQWLACMVTFFQQLFAS